MDVTGRLSFRISASECLWPWRKSVYHSTRRLVLTHRPLGNHDGVLKWKHFPHNWPFVRGIHRSPVNSPHKGQWRVALMFSLICVWVNDWVNNREAGDLRHYRAHYDVTVMCSSNFECTVLELIIQNSSLDTHCEIGPRWTQQNVSYQRPTLIHVMAWCRQATLHVLYAIDFGAKVLTYSTRNFEENMSKLSLSLQISWDRHSND